MKRPSGEIDGNVLAERSVRTAEADHHPAGEPFTLAVGGVQMGLRFA